MKYFLIETAYGYENLLHPIIEFFDNVNLAKTIWTFVQFENFNINKKVNSLIYNINFEANLFHQICVEKRLDNEFMKILIASPQVDVNIQTTKGYTPLMLSSSRPAIFEALLKREDLNLHLKDCNDRNILIRVLFGSGKKSARFTGKSKKTYRLAKLLLSRKDLDVNVKNPKNGETLSTWARERKYFDILEILSKRYNPNVKNQKKRKFIKNMIGGRKQKKRKMN